MKRLLILLVVATLLLASAYFLTKGNDSTENNTQDSFTTYSSAELGIEFKYKAGDEGYILQEMTPFEKTADFLRAIILMRTVDAKNGMPEGGEGPPTITVSVFRNLKNQPPLAWAEENIQHSNLNLKIGEVTEGVVGGRSAVRYMADGLYVSENVVVANGENIYVITGMYIDPQSAIRKDFSPFVESVKLIP